MKRFILELAWASAIGVLAASAHDASALPGAAGTATKGGSTKSAGPLSIQKN